MTMEPPKPSESGAAWASGDVASGWLRGAAARGRALRPPDRDDVDLAGVTIGSQVLDLGAGTGDQTLLAARKVGPGGAVLATDLSASMLDLAREAAHAAGLGNVQTQVMDAQHLERRSGSFDAAMKLAPASSSSRMSAGLGWSTACAEARRPVRGGGLLGYREESVPLPARRRCQPTGRSASSSRPGPVNGRSTIRPRCSERSTGRLPGGGRSAGALRVPFPLAGGRPAQPGGGATAARQAAG